MNAIYRMPQNSLEQFIKHSVYVFTNLLITWETFMTETSNSVLMCILIIRTSVQHISVIQFNNSKWRPYKLISWKPTIKMLNRYIRISSGVFGYLRSFGCLQVFRRCDVITVILVDVEYTVNLTMMSQCDLIL